MHARVQIVNSLPEQFTAPAAERRFVDVLASQTGFMGLHLLLQIGSRRGLCLSFWRSADDAQAAPAKTQAQLGPRPFPLAVDDVYEVMDVMKGTADPEECAVAQATWFDGPRSAAEVAAARRAGEERIRPAVEGLPGLGLTYVLVRPEDSATVLVSLATSTQVLDEVAAAIARTTLLPGEDPALLPGPDRVEVYHRLGQRVPAER